MAADFNFSAGRRHPRGPSLTPMIDVVFLLLVFFMLAARFGVESALPLPAAGGSGEAWSGAPRLVDISPEGVALNGAALSEAALAGEVLKLTGGSDNPVILRPRAGASVQRVVSIAELLNRAGLTQLILAE